MPETPQGELDPRRYLRVIWRWKWLLLPLVVLTPVAVYLISSNVPKTYEASTTLHLQQTTFSSSLFSNQISVSTSTAGEAARLIQTTAVAREAASNLDEPASVADELLSQIEVESDTTDSSEASNFLSIVASDEDPERAAEIANAFADAVATTRTEDALTSIDRALDALTAEARAGQAAADEATAATLAEQLQQLRALRATQSNTTQVLDPATPPGSPVSPHPRRNAAVGIVLALLLAAGLVPLLDRLDRRLRNPEELEGLTGGVLLSMVPQSAFPGEAPDPRVREAFQTLRAGLTSFNIDRQIASVIVTSPIHGEGKTTVAVNLAIALALDQKDVILVDGDMRRSQVAQRLGADPRVGLEAVLMGERSLDDGLLEIDIEADRGRLRILPVVSHPPNAAVLLGSQRMRSLLSELSERADLVIIDTPPLLSVSDAIPLLDQVSGAVLIARMDYSRRDALRRARQLIETARGTLLGVVATGTRAGGLYGGYGYGYEYDTPSDGHGEAARVSANGEGRVAGGEGKSGGRRRLGRRSG